MKSHTVRVNSIRTPHANTHIYFHRPATTSSQTKSTIPFVLEHIRSRQTYTYIRLSAHHIRDTVYVF